MIHFISPYFTLSDKCTYLKRCLQIQLISPLYMENLLKLLVVQMEAEQQDFMEQFILQK